MADKKVVVLGANSFSGQDFTDLLLDNSAYQVIGVSRSPERSSLFLRYKLRSSLPNYKYHQLDMNQDTAKILQMLDAEKPDMIVNFAAQSEVGPSWDHPEHWFQTNCVSLAAIVNHLRKQTYLKRYVHISSPEVYGNCVGNVTEASPMNPSTPYAASKAGADFLLDVFRKQYNFPLMTVRATNVYGERQQLFKIIPRTVIYLKTGKKIELHGGGVAVKSYIHVRDVSRGELAVLERGEIGKMYHLSPDGGVSVKHVVETLCKRMGKKFEESVMVAPERPGQDAAYVIDSTRARKELGWKPEIKIEEGLSMVIKWADDYWKEIEAQPLQYIHKP